jgi:hypothetical protein
MRTMVGPFVQDIQVSTQSAAVALAQAHWLGHKLRNIHLSSHSIYKNWLLSQLLWPVAK